MLKLVDVCIEITQKCFHNCIYCSSNSNENKTDIISYEQVNKIISFCKKNKVSNVAISGGEPLLHDNIDKIINQLNHLDKYYIYTSGNYPDDILNKLMDCDKSKVVLVFNYQSYFPIEFKKLTDTNYETYLQVNKNLSILLNKGFNIELNIVPNLINLTTLYGTCIKMYETGIKKINLLRFVPQGRGELNKNILNISPHYDNVLKHIIDDIKWYCMLEDVKLKCGIPLNNLQDDFKHKCKAGFQKLVFNFTGNVYPCEAFKGCLNKERFILGNIYQDSIEDIWKNGVEHKEIKQLRIKIKHG